MTKYVKVILLAALFIILNVPLNAQQKKAEKKLPAKNTTEIIPKFIPKGFSSPVSVSDIIDEKETNPEYESVKNLIETNGVTLAYADSSFRPKDPLRRGDFVVSFNAALNAIKKAGDAGGIDSNMVNTYDKNQTYITHVSDIKDVKESSVYYTAVQSLIERWGIAAPFAKSKLLNAGAPMPEADVYDILKVTLGYNSAGANPYVPAMTRAKFAMVLNNALNLKLTQVNSLAGSRKDSIDNLRIQEEAMLKMQDKQRKDSMAKDVELSRINAQKKEAEAWSKLSDSQKRKQLKSQQSK